VADLGWCSGVVDDFFSHDRSVGVAGSVVEGDLGGFFAEGYPVGFYVGEVVKIKAGKGVDF
jgi:hypothetical protein